MSLPNKWGACVLVAIGVNGGLLMGMEYMTRSERTLLTKAIPVLPVDFLRLSAKPEEARARRYAQPPPPAPTAVDEAVPNIEVDASIQPVGPMPQAIALARITPGLDTGGARLAGARLASGASQGGPAGGGAPVDLPFVDESALITLVRIAPTYPMSALRRKLEGDVLVRFVITEGGHVQNPYVVRAEPAGVFEQAALAAIQQWRFRPEVRNGEPTAVLTQVNFRFRVDR